LNKILLEIKKRLLGMPLSTGSVYFFRHRYVSKPSPNLPYLSLDVLRRITEFSREFDEEKTLDEMYNEYNGMHCDCDKVTSYSKNHYFALPDSQGLEDQDADVILNQNDKVIEIVIDHDLDYDFKDGGGDCWHISEEHSFKVSRILPSIRNFYFLETLVFNCVQLTGEIPMEIGFLRNLRELKIYNDFYRNSNDAEQISSIGGKLPLTIANLTKLEELSLHNMNLSGENIEVISHLTNLNELKLCNIFKNGDRILPLPEFIFSMKKLECIKMSNCFEGEIPISIGNLDKLHTFIYDLSTGKIPINIFTTLNINYLNLGSRVGIVIDFTSCDPKNLKQLKQYSHIENFEIIGERPKIYEKILETHLERDLRLQSERLEWGVQNDLFTGGL
jgi:hypothetical protein